MKYDELLELYKKGELDETKKEQVSYDIEKHEAISNYLIENDELFSKDFDEPSIETSEGDTSNDFSKMIKHAIQKAFIKAGVITSLVILAAVFFVIYALPKIVNKFYYNPAKVLSYDVTGAIDTYQFQLDYATYSEIFLPGKYRFQSIVNDLGYGNYDITLIQNISYGHPFINVGGRIEKNNLILYNPNIIKQPTANAFAFEIAGVNKKIFTFGTAAAGYAEDNKDYIDSLYDNTVYRAFITLDTVMSYTDFEKWCEENDEYPEWLALCTQAEDGSYETGFIWGTNALNTSCGALSFDEEKYPYLTLFSLFDTDKSHEAMLTQHVISMLSYLHDQDKFDKMIELDRDTLKYMEENVTANGLNIYGYVSMTDKEALKATFEKDHVGYIYTDTDF